MVEQLLGVVVVGDASAVAVSHAILPDLDGSALTGGFELDFPNLLGGVNLDNVHAVLSTVVEG